MSCYHAAAMGQTSRRAAGLQPCCHVCCVLALRWRPRSQHRGAAAPQHRRQQAPADRLAELEAAVARAPKRTRGCIVLLGLAYWDQNDNPRALDAFQRAVEVGPGRRRRTTGSAWRCRGRRIFPARLPNSGRPSRSIREYGRALHESRLGTRDRAATTPRRWRYSRRRWRSSRTASRRPSEPRDGAPGEGRSRSALEHLSGVAAAEPRHAGVHYELGQALRQTGDLPGAVAAFEKAVELDPELREGYYGLGQALKQQGASARKSGAARPASRGRIVERARRRRPRAAT